MYNKTVRTVEGYFIQLDTYKHMVMERMGVEKSPLRAELGEMTSPLARLLFEMPQNRSLERIDAALNGTGQPWGIFDMVADPAAAQGIFDKLKAVTDLGEGSPAAVAQMRKICEEIDQLS